MKVSARIALLVPFLMSFTGCAPEGGGQSTSGQDPSGLHQPSVRDVPTGDPFAAVGTSSALQSFDPYQQMLAQNGSSSDDSPFPDVSTPPEGTGGFDKGSGGQPPYPNIPEWQDPASSTVPQTGQTPYQTTPHQGWNDPSWGGQPDAYMAGQAVSGLISVGMMIYNIVQANQPQVSADTHSISVLPPDFSENWEKMSGWTGPHVRTFELKVKNWLGQTNVKFEYNVVYYANGSLNGKGAYLANLQVVPTVVDIPYSFKFDARFEAGDIINVGTPEDPIAGVHFQLQWRLHSAMKRLQGVDSFFVSGDSELKAIR